MAAGVPRALSCCARAPTQGTTTEGTPCTGVAPGRGAQDEPGKPGGSKGPREPQESKNNPIRRISLRAPTPWSKGAQRVEQGANGERAERNAAPANVSGCGRKRQQEGRRSAPQNRPTPPQVAHGQHPSPRCGLFPFPGTTRAQRIRALRYWKMRHPAMSFSNSATTSRNAPVSRQARRISADTLPLDAVAFCDLNCHC